ncbi:hypothetical protein JKG47_22600, partial [Acidithiobacillus sp. MC6.1]|nr:hypothetical protein [Acidithiobacillus sp. MC6.1]
MKRRFTGIFLSMVALLVISLGVWLIVGRHNDRENPERAKPAAARLATMNGLTTVVLSPSAQTQGGIEVHALQPARYQPQTNAYGVVIDPQPLFDLRTRYITAAGQVAAAR